jgi:hypothetical protein
LIVPQWQSFAKDPHEVRARTAAFTDERVEQESVRLADGPRTRLPLLQAKGDKEAYQQPRVFAYMTEQEETIRAGPAK